jgi:hypothetical protein
VTAELLKLGGSVIAIIAVFWLVRWMGFGATHERIRDVAHAIALADEAECGFAGVSAVVDMAGYGALVTNAAGAVMLVRAHGNRFAARRIGPGWHARLNRRMLELSAADSTFGTVTLDLGEEAGAVAARLRHVLGGGLSHA